MAGEEPLFIQAGMNRDQFLESEQVILIISRLLEIVGEAAKRIPEPFRRQNPDVSWKDISGIRDMLIHAYFRIEVERLWSMVERDLPPLRSARLRILEDAWQP